MPIASVLQILRTIKDRGPISRTDLQQVTGLSWGTVTNTTRELLNRELVREQGALSTKAGRKPVQLALNPGSQTMLGAEITGERVEAMLINLAGETLWREAVELSAGLSTDAVLAQAAELIRRGMGKRGPMGVGLVVPDPMDRGQTASGTGSSWKDLPVGQWLEARLHVPVYVERHANGLALAHRWFGPADTAGTDDFVCLDLGETIGLGIVSGGEIFRGHTGMAGQVAHVSVDPAGPACPCGRRGCLEVYCSMGAVILAGTLTEMVAKAASGDAAARAAFERMGTHLGMGILTLARLLDPAMFVLTGKMMAAAEQFMPAVERSLAGKPIRVVRSQLAAHGAMLGVCALILQHAFDPQSAPPRAEAMPA